MDGNRPTKNGGYLVMVGWATRLIVAPPNFNLGRGEGWANKRTFCPPYIGLVFNSPCRRLPV